MAVLSIVGVGRGAGGLFDGKMTHWPAGKGMAQCAPAGGGLRLSRERALRDVEE